MKDPTTWADFHSAVIVAEQLGCGIGYVITEDDPFVCIDLDWNDAERQMRKGQPIDQSKWSTEEDLNRYHKIIETFESYTEWSRSGKGFHVWVRGYVGDGCRRGGVEVYDRARFIIFTGDVAVESQIHERQCELDLLVGEMRKGQYAAVSLPELPQQYTDAEIIERASNAANRVKFLTLWSNRWKEEGYPSQSEADFALLSMLCFYSRSNDQVRRVFRLSGLGKRDKATKNDVYLNRTLGSIRSRQQAEGQLDSISAEHGKQIAEKLLAGMIEKQRQEQENRVAEIRQQAAKVIREAHQELEGLEKLDWPPGLMGDLAKWLYSIAPRPVKEIAIISALAAFTGLAGRLFSISNSGLNLYLILVARSAVGKEAIHSGLSALIHQVNLTSKNSDTLINFGKFVSAVSLSKYLVENPCICNIVGEWGRILKRMAEDQVESQPSQMRTLMTELYQKSSSNNIIGNIRYSDKEKNIDAVHGVAFSMLGETTPDTLYEALTPSMMHDGFLSRFILVDYNGDRPPLNAVTSIPALPAHIKGKVTELCAKNLEPYHQRPVGFTPEAKSAFDEFDEMCDKKINSTDDEAFRQMWNRAHLKVLKVSALLAVASGDLKGEILVELEHVKWALTLIKSDIKLLNSKIVSGVIGAGDTTRERKMCDELKKYLAVRPTSGYKIRPGIWEGAYITWSYLKNKLFTNPVFNNHPQGHTRAMELTIQSLISSGIIEEVPRIIAKATLECTGKVYKIINLPDDIGVAPD